MKAIRITTAIFLVCIAYIGKGQENQKQLNGFWQIGLGLGELPIDGSFKPSITLGYHFNDHLYTGIIYQFKDKISRNGSSFNAQAAELDGLVSSSEKVAQRFMAQVRYTPIKNGPYISGGFVFNGKDEETMLFDDRSRTVAEGNYQGTIEIQQSRPAGWGVALGIGYQYNLSRGLSAGFEWTPAWGQYPTPTYSFSGTADLSITAKDDIKNMMNQRFRKSVTNMYKVFHLGLAYRFQ